jgi:hypothetical protein
MSHYKRNQVEEAISRTIGEKSAKPSSGLRTRLKRLLDLDRSLKGARSEGSGGANYAFYSSDAPGKGGEVLFSNYDAFALLTGLRMLNHGWPQNFVVTTLRSIRTELKARHSSALKMRSNMSTSEPRAGDLAGANPASPFLLIVSDDRTASPPNDQGPYAMIFANQEDAFRFQMQAVGRSCSWFELEAAAKALKANLARALPRSRGRSA